MNISKVKEVYDSPLIDSEINIGGWVRAFRANKFIELNDGSTIKNIQCVIDDGIIGEDIIKRISVGCSLIITGILVNSIGKGQSFEINVSNIKLLESIPKVFIHPSIRIHPQRTDTLSLRKQIKPMNLCEWSINFWTIEINLRKKRLLTAIRLLNLFVTD